MKLLKIISVVLAIVGISAIVYATNNPAGTANDPFRKTPTVVGACDPKTGYGIAVNKFGGLAEIKSVKNATNTASTTITANAALFYGVIINANTANGFVLVYDGPVATGTLIADVNAVTASDGKSSLILPFGIKAASGIYVNGSNLGASGLCQVLYTD